MENGSLEVTILMATYNGEKFLRPQLESIITQTYENWNLWIRDDCSSDSTVEILKEYVIRDARIRILDNSNNRLGACQNFGELMKSADCSNHIMFADQDDVWNKDKIELTVSKFWELELSCDRNTPLLLHTNFQFVDSNLNNIKYNYGFVLKFYKNPGKILNKLFSQNFIYGCTMMINKALLEACIPVYPHAENHDYWIGMVAASVGQIHYLPRKTMLFRQHLSNVSVGIKSKTFINRFRRNVLNYGGLHEINSRRVTQLAALRRRLDNRLSLETKNLIDTFLQKVKVGGLGAVLFAYKNQIQRQGAIQTLIYYITLIKPVNNYFERE